MLEPALPRLHQGPDEPAGGLVHALRHADFSADPHRALLPPAPQACVEPRVGQKPRLELPLPAKDLLPELRGFEGTEDLGEPADQRSGELFDRELVPGLPLQGGQVLPHGAVDLVPELLVRYAEDPGHGFVVEIRDQVAHQHQVVADLGHAGPRNLAPCLGHDVVDRFEPGGHTEIGVRVDHRLQEPAVELGLVPGGQGVVSVQHQLEEDLPPVQVHGPAPDFAPEHRDAQLTAGRQVDFLLEILVVADAHVGLPGGQDVKALDPRARLRVVQ